MYYEPKKRNWKRIVILLVLAFSLGASLLVIVPLMRNRQPDADTVPALSSKQQEEQARVSRKMEATQALREVVDPEEHDQGEVSRRMADVQKRLESVK